MNRLSELAKRIETNHADDDTAWKVADALRESEKLLLDLDEDLQRALKTNPSFIVRAVIERKRERILALLGPT